MVELNGLVSVHSCMQISKVEIITSCIFCSPFEPICQNSEHLVQPFSPHIHLNSTHPLQQFALHEGLHHVIGGCEVPGLVDHMHRLESGRERVLYRTDRTSFMWSSAIWYTRLWTEGNIRCLPAACPPSSSARCVWCRTRAASWSPWSSQWGQSRWFGSLRFLEVSQGLRSRHAESVKRHICVWDRVIIVNYKKSYIKKKKTYITYKININWKYLNKENKILL